MVAKRRGVSFSAWSGERFIPLVEVLLAIGRWVLQSKWRLQNAEFATGFRGSDELNVMSSQFNAIPTLSLVDLVSDGVQMIGGDLCAFHDTEAEPFLVVRSVRGDEWDVECDDVDVLAAIREAFGDVQELPR